jgi:hypothetical protein
MSGMGNDCAEKIYFEKYDELGKGTEKIPCQSHEGM